MGLWDSIARKGHSVSGPVRQVAELEFLEQNLAAMKLLLVQGINDPIARFARNMPDEAADFRGKDVFLSPNTGVFTIYGGTTMGVMEFFQLVSLRTLRLNASMETGYAPVMESLLNIPDEDDPLMGEAIPAELLVYDEASTYGLVFDGSPEMRWLGDMLRLHAGVVKNIVRLESRIGHVKMEVYEASEGREKRRIPIPWAQAGVAAANLAAPGIGFSFTGDWPNTATWFVAVPLLSLSTWTLTGQAVLPAALVWLACGLVTARHTYLHWHQKEQQHERAMAVVPVAALLVFGIDRILLGRELVPRATGYVGRAADMLPAGVGDLVFGTSGGGHWSLVVFLFLTALLSVLGWGGYKHWKRVRYGAA